MKLIITLLVTTVVAVIACILQAVLHDELADSNRDLTVEIQSISSDGLDDFFIYLSTATRGLFVAIPAFDFTTISRDRGFYATMASLSSVVLFSLLKNMYCHPRPYWIYDDVRAIKCSSSWGAPSGHSIMATSTCVYYMLFAGKRWWLYPIWTSIILLVALDRVYLGVHSYFQVLLGFLVSLPELLLWYLASRKHLLEASIRVRVCLLVLAFALFLLNLLLFLLRDPEIEEKWEIHYEDKCDEELDADENMMNEYLDGNVVLMATAFYAGFYWVKDKSDITRHWKPVGLAVLLTLALFILYMVLDEVLEGSLEGAALAILSALKNLLSGLVLGYGVPKLIQLVDKRSDKT